MSTGKARQELLCPCNPAEVLCWGEGLNPPPWFQTPARFYPRERGQPLPCFCPLAPSSRMEKACLLRFSPTLKQGVGGMAMPRLGVCTPRPGGGGVKPRLEYGHTPPPLKRVARGRGKSLNPLPPQICLKVPVGAWSWPLLSARAGVGPGRGSPLPPKADLGCKPLTRA